MAVVAFDTPDGEPIATLINLAIHPVVLGPDNLEYSADFPGAMMSLVERRVGGAGHVPAVQLATSTPSETRRRSTEGAYEQVRRLGETAGAEVVRVRRGLTFADVDVTTIGIERVPVSLRWDLEDPVIRSGVRRAYLARFEREGEAEVAMLLIKSDLALASFPGEFFVEHGLRLKRESLVANTLLVGYSNGHLGYGRIPDFPEQCSV